MVISVWCKVVMVVVVVLELWCGDLCGMSVCVMGIDVGARW
jgi:hypothetical protein